MTNQELGLVGCLPTAVVQPHCEVATTCARHSAVNNDGEAFTFVAIVANHSSKVSAQVPHVRAFVLVVESEVVVPPYGWVVCRACSRRIVDEATPILCTGLIDEAHYFTSSSLNVSHTFSLTHFTKVNRKTASKVHFSPVLQMLKTSFGVTTEVKSR